jgi:hypothetical protein
LGAQGSSLHMVATSLECCNCVLCPWTVAWATFYSLLGEGSIVYSFIVSGLNYKDLRSCRCVLIHHVDLSWGTADQKPLSWCLPHGMFIFDQATLSWWRSLAPSLCMSHNPTTRVGQWIGNTHDLGLLWYLSALWRYDEFVDKFATCFGTCQTGLKDGACHLRLSWYAESMYWVRVCGEGLPNCPT